jgi:hypothetical protein
MRSKLKCGEISYNALKPADCASLRHPPSLWIREDWETMGLHATILYHTVCSKCHPFSSVRPIHAYM